MSAQLIKIHIVGENQGPSPGLRVDAFVSISAILTVKQAGGDAYTIILKPEYEATIIKKYFGSSQAKIQSINGQIPKAAMDELLGVGKV